MDLCIIYTYWCPKINDIERERKGNKMKKNDTRGRSREKNRVPFTGHNTCLLITHSCISASVTNYPPPLLLLHTVRRRPRRSTSRHYYTITLYYTLKV